MNAYDELHKIADLCVWYLRLCLPVKAGGMRIVQKHQSAVVPEAVPKEEKDEEEYETTRYGSNYTHTHGYFRIRKTH